MNHSIKLLLIFTIPFNFIIGSEIIKKGCKYPEIPGAPQQQEPVPASLLLSQGLIRQTEAMKLARAGGGNPANLHTLNNEAVIFFQSYIDCLKASQSSPGAYALLFKSFSLYDLNALNEAMAAAEEAISLDSGLRDAYLLKSRILIGQGKYKEASDFLEANISRFPEDSDSLFLLASLNMQTGNDSRAILYFISLNDNIKNREGDLKYRSPVLRNLADLYYRAGDNRKAAFYYKLYLNYEDTVNERMKLAKIHSLTGNFIGAKKELVSILRQYPERSDVIELLGEIIFIENRYEAYLYLSYYRDKLRKKSLAADLFNLLSGLDYVAEKRIRTFTEKSPERLASRLAWLELLERKGDWEGFYEETRKSSELAYQYRQYLLAASLAERLIELYPAHPEWKLNRSAILDFISGCYEGASSPNRAILNVQQAIDVSGNGEEAGKIRLHLALLLRNEQIAEYDKSLNIIKSVIAHNPAFSYPWFLQGIVNYEIKNYPASLSSISKAIELESGNSTYYYYLALVNDSLKKPVETEAALRKALELNPNYSGAYNYLGYFLLVNGKKYNEALELVKKAVELEPDNPAYRDSLGWAYYKLEQYADARYHLNLALQVMAEGDGPVDPVVLDHIGDVYLKENDIINAVEYWNKSLKLHQDETEKQKIKDKIKQIK